MSEDPRAAAGKPKRMRLGVIVRLCIYIPLLGFFGWRAWERFADERTAADQEFRVRVQDRLQQPPRVIMLPNGEAMQVISPEEAAAMGVEIQPKPAEPAPEPSAAEPSAAEPSAPE